MQRDAEAERALARCDRRALASAQMMGEAYRELLLRMRRRNFNVFATRVSLSRTDKALIAAQVLVRTSL